MGATNPTSKNLTLLTVLLMVTAAVPLLVGTTPSASAQTGAAGVFVSPSDTDATRIVTATFPPGQLPLLVCRDTDGTAGCTVDDPYYIHFNTNPPPGGATIKQNDLKFAGTTTGAASNGQWLTSTTTTDVGQAFIFIGQLGTAAAPIRCLELDGVSGWSLSTSMGDGLYVDIGTQFGGAVGDGVLNQGDLRALTRSTPVSVTAGTVVKTLTENDIAAAGDASKFPRSTAFGCVVGEGATTFVPLWYDHTKNGVVDPTDTILISPPGQTQVVPEIGDAVITQSTLGGGSFGTQLTTLPTQVKQAMPILTGTAMEPMLAIEEAAAGTSIKDQRLYIHFPDPDGVDDDILENDLQVSGVGRTAGTRVTTETGGQGMPIGCTGITGCTAPTALLSGLIYYIENDGLPGFTQNDPMFINRPATMGGGGAACEPCVSVGDIRVTRAFVGSHPAGSVVEAGHQDIAAYSGTAGIAGFAVKSFDANRDNAIQLDSLSGAKIGRHLAGAGAPPSPPFPGGCTGVGPYPTTGTCHFFDPVNDNIYTSCPSSAVATGCVRLYVGTGSGAPAAGTTVACPADSDCPGNADDVGALAADNAIRTTGTDTAFEPGFSEWVVYSIDAKVGPGDVRVSGAPGGGAGTFIVAGDPETTLVSPLSITSTDKLLVSLDPCGPCWMFPQVNDVFLGSWGQILTSTSTEVARRLTVIPDTADGAIRYNRGDPTTISDDTFLVSTGAAALPPAAVARNDIRLTPGPGGAAFTIVESDDTEELGATGKTFDGATPFTSRIYWVEVDGFAGPTNGGATSGSSTSADWVYADTAGGPAPGTLVGNPPATAGRDQGDVRLTKAVATGTFNAGTVVRAGDSDLSSTGIGLMSPSGAPDRFFLYYFDANGNGVFDGVSSTSTANDVLYLHYTATGLIDIALPHVNDIRLTGTGGGTTTGGGGTTPPPPPPPTTTTTPASISISNPAAGSFVQTGDTVTISGSASAGTTSGVANTVSSIAVTVGGTALTGVTGTTSWSVPWTPTTDGTHTITATVTPSSGSAQSVSVTVTSNPTGTAPGTDGGDGTDGTDGGDGDTGPVDQEARDRAESAQTAAENAQTAAENAQQTAEQARDAAEGARDAAVQNEESAQRILDQLVNGTGDGDGVPGFDLLAALGAVGIALMVRRRRMGA